MSHLHGFRDELIQAARKLYISGSFAVELEQMVYALDTTTIGLCFSVFPWARFRSTKAVVKMHTLLGLRDNIPTFIHISDGRVHEVNVLDLLIPEADNFYIILEKAVIHGFRRLTRINKKVVIYYQFTRRA